MGLRANRRLSHAVALSAPLRQPDGEANAASARQAALACLLIPSVRRTLHVLLRSVAVARSTRWSCCGSCWKGCR